MSNRKREAKEEKKQKTPAERLAAVADALKANNIVARGTPVPTPQGILIPRVDWIDLGTNLPIRSG